MKHAHKFYIDGEWVAPSVSKTLEVIDPSTKQPMGTIALGSAADAEKAVAAARQAFASFSQTSKEERVELLKRIVTILKRRNDELGDVISREMGAPLAMARAEQAGIGAAHFEQTIKAFETFAFEYMQGSHRARAGRARRHDHAVELADQPDRLQGGAGARHGMHHGAEALGDRSVQRRDLRRDHG